MLFKSAQTRQDNNVKGLYEFHGGNVISRPADEFRAVAFVKDVVMQAAVFRIPQATLAELFRRTGRLIPRQVVEGKNFRQVS